MTQWSCRYFFLHWFAYAITLCSTACLGRADDSPKAKTGYKSHVQPFLQDYCIHCHGLDEAKSDVNLHDMAIDFAEVRDVEGWDLVYEMLRSGSMPPDDVEQPSDDERQRVTEWIELRLREYVANASHESPVPTARRLTNIEYQNTINDLLGFELNLIRNLPEDPVKPYRFNNSAQFMLIGPEQMDRYKENARLAMSSAIVDSGEPKVYRQIQTWNPSLQGDKPIAPAEIPVYQGPGVGTKTVGIKQFPTKGEYLIRIKAAGNFPDGYGEVPLRLVMGTNLRSDSGTGNYVPVGTVHLSNGVDDIREFEFRGRIENHPVQVGRVTAKGQAPSTLVITAQNLFDNGELNDHRRSAFDASWSASVPRVVMTSLEFEAPVTKVWPPEHHTRILFDSPLRKSDPEAYLREVLRRFISRAFRRPANSAEIQRFVKIYDLLEGQFETFEDAMRETLAMVLISPQFLYHTVSRDPEQNSQYALAAKLSYFLWASMPDEELTRLAEDRLLDDPAMIETQVLRMLADQRSERFVETFSAQWLSLNKMKVVNINQDLFPRFLYYVHVGERRGQEVMFRPTIRDYMYAESVGFLGELIRRNAHVMNLVDSDFAYLNEPLAAHYGVEGVKGLEFRSVPINREHHLGGLLTQGSVLIGNGTGSAPHPIYRAVWLREAILGDHVKEPPAEVPALVDSAGETADQAVTIKDLLAKHRTVESCNDCHARLDPWGIPFERYNAVGKYQPKVAKEGTRVSGFNQKQHVDHAGYREYLNSIYTNPVQADARIPHGPKIDGMRELKDFLLHHRQDAVVENVVRRLLSYSLGRDLTYRDRFVVEELTRQARDSDYRLRDIIIDVCQSEIFRSTGTKED